MWRVVLLLLPSATLADSLVATRVIRPQETLVADAVTLVSADIPGALTDPMQAIGQEARVAIYPGRAILAEHLGAAALGGPLRLATATDHETPCNWDLARAA